MPCAAWILSFRPRRPMMKRAVLCWIDSNSRSASNAARRQFMAKYSMIARDAKLERLVAKYAAKRAAIKERIKDPEATPQERFAAVQELQRIPRDASPSRQRN